MKTILFHIITIILLFCFNGCTSQKNIQMSQLNISKLEYFDGSGNAYYITSEKISYIPITREKSSSGMYDGGKEVHKSIRRSDFEEMIVQFDLVFRNKEIHIKNRIKTSGVLIRINNQNIAEDIIISKSGEQQKLEEFLKSFFK